jgi:hypothetical protein
MLQALTDKSQENVEGVARLRLYKGSARVVGRKSPRSLYSPASATPKASSNLTPAPAPRCVSRPGYMLIRRSVQSLSRSVVDADIEALAHRPQGLIDLLDLRAVAQIEEAVHLGRVPPEPASQLCLCHANGSRDAIEFYLCCGQRRECYLSLVRFRWRQIEAHLAATAQSSSSAIGGARWCGNVFTASDPGCEGFLDCIGSTPHRVLLVISEGRHLR